MLHLYLYRHAKSSWKSGQDKDFDRPLNARGYAAATAMACHLAESCAEPALVLCSAALRARETLAKAIPIFSHDYEISIENGLYLADPPVLLKRIKALPPEAANSMLIGHNPGLHQLSQLLAAEGATDAMQKLRAKFPTAAVAEIMFDERNWAAVEPGTGYLRRFVMPRDLPQSC